MTTKTQQGTPPTTHPQSITNQQPMLKARQMLMRANGAFLTLVGGTQMSFELLSYYAGRGPLGQIFAGSHYTIGWVEAHGLAFLIGLLLSFVASGDPKRSWHGFAVCVHLLLGGSNLLFWQSFVFWERVPMGIVATAIHGLFLAAQLYCFVRASSRGASMTATDYEIRVQGHLDSHWSAWFNDLTISNEANGEAVLRGRLPDQAALHGVLIKVRDLGLPLIAVISIANDRSPHDAQ